MNPHISTSPNQSIIHCPLLRKIYNDVLDEYYLYDRHFESPLLDWLREIEKANVQMYRCVNVQMKAVPDPE